MQLDNTLRRRDAALVKNFTFGLRVRSATIATRSEVEYVESQ